MGEVHLVTWGVPFCQKSQGEQTSTSIALRTTAIIFGVIAATIGILLVHGEILSIGGWVAFSFGAFFAAAGILIQCQKTFVSHERSLSVASGNSKVQTNGTLLRPTWYQRPQKKGYQSSKTLNEKALSANVEALKTMSGGSDVRQMNVYPLCFQIQEDDNRIVVDLASHIEVSSKPVVSIEKDGEVSYSTLESNPLSLIGTGKKVTYTLSASSSHFVLKSLPGVLFFTAHNGIQLEVGYIDIHALLKREVEFKVNKDKSITYS